MKRSTFLRQTTALVAGAATLSAFRPADLPSGNRTIVPKRLVKGDRIGITAPAGAIWNKKHIEKIQTLLHEMGFKTQLGETLYAQEGYLAGSDEMRVKELMDFFTDRSIKAILTMRGGWGCARILDLIDYEQIKQNPKIVIGFSDITSLINAIYAKTGLVTYHGPCGYSSWGDFTTEQVTAALVSGQPYQLKNPDNYTDPQLTLTGGKAQGHLIGGNLTVMTSLVGTPYAPNWQNSLLFLEEIGEEPYRVDRMLWQLKQAGVFDQINGLIIGSFKKCTPEEPEKSFTLQQVFDQHFSQASFPVYRGAAFGHIGPKFTLPIGIQAQMDADLHEIRTLERSVI